MFEINECQKPLCFENRYRALEMSHDEKKITKPYHIQQFVIDIVQIEYNVDYVTDAMSFCEKMLTCMYQRLNVQRS